MSITLDLPAATLKDGRQWSMLSNVCETIISKLKFYTQPHYHSSLKLEKDMSKMYSHKPLPRKLVKDSSKKNNEE